MFKKIQNHLLIHHPLLWNSKIVPIAAILIVFNILFYALGLITGAIDFSETERNYRSDSDTGIILFFGALVAILALIVWLVFYLKNNAFKSFYPKKNHSLFKEWLLILLTSCLLCGFPISFLLGNDVRVRSYFSKEEAINRCETISLASLFIEGSFNNNGYEIVDSAGVKVNRRIDHIFFQGKKYPLSSLLNKNIEKFTIFGSERDSLNEIKVKSWLVNNQKDAVAKVMDDFLIIAKEHNLEANIDTKAWLDLVYNYPEFEEVKIVGQYEKDFYFENDADEYETDFVKAPKTTIDSLNQYVKVVNGERYIFYKHYVPASALLYSYSKISESWANPKVDIESFMVYFNIAMWLSIVIFSYRVSSGRNWLIALISVGVLNIIFGIFSAIMSFSSVYLILMVVTILTLFIYFLSIIARKKGKEISGITINALLWMFPSFVPMSFFLIMKLIKITSGYNDAKFLDQQKLFPSINWLESNEVLIFYLNLLFVFFGMILFSVKIKKWKGIAES